jgi:hypothetical protein
MDLMTIEIPRARAHEKAAEYRRAAKTITDQARRREFEQIARAYRIAARDDVPMIALTDTIRRGGTVSRTKVFRYRNGEERREHYLLTALAVCRASASFVYTRGVSRKGGIEFVDSLGRAWNYRRGLIDLETRFDLPTGYERGHSLVGGSSYGAWSSMVPVVPPKHRPSGAGDLSGYLVLWEVESWEWSQVPPPPGDPALLRHVGGDIYAVLATWDLTELERLVLSGRRPE